jgi:diguanylate cyclase
MRLSDPLLIESLDDQLVALSIFIAILWSYAALDLAARLISASGGLRESRLRWAFASGIDIGSVYHAGMMALRRPVPVEYD